MPRLLIDGHADTAQRFVNDAWNFTEALSGGHLSFETARGGGLGAEFFAAWAEPTQWRDRYAERTLALIGSVREQAERYPGQLRLCTTPAEILAAQADGRFAMLLSIEGGHSIENDLGLLRRFHSLGVRYMTLTWSNSNEWADSSGDLDNASVKHHGGLTGFGREVIREMNRLGMMIDVSHVSDETFDAVLATTRTPIIASHSSARALTAAPRNLSDEMLHRLAANGGMAMVNFFPAFIDEAWRAAWNTQRKERQEAHQDLAATHPEPIPFTHSNAIDRRFAERIPRAPLASLINHIDYVAQIAGIEHVGLGTDFDGIPALPDGLDSAADLPKVFDALADRGYTAEDLDGIAGGNLLRVFDTVLAAADPPGGYPDAVQVTFVR